MTNEELVVLIQGGDRNKLPELWGKVRPMALREARRWAACRSGGAELQDFEQAGFIALMLAVGSFDPAAGYQLSTWYYPIMRSEFQRTAGRRTSKQAQDPLQQAVSLDVSVGEDEDGATLGELIPDPAAEAAVLDVEERDRRDRLHTALEAAIATLPPDLQAAIRGRYYCGERVNNRAHSKAMRMLRAPKCSQALRVFL